MSIPANDAPDALAIVGMSGRFPRAANIDEFWANLRSGLECISFFSPEEMEEAGMAPAFFRHPSFVNAGGVLDGIEMFDAGFFGLSPREAEIQDPQQRLFLECSWEALEHAGYDPHKYDGAIGVFGGSALSSYLFNIISNPELMALVGTFQVLLGNDKDHVSTQVSYKLNLKGPSVTVQTACSTSLVAVCMACQSLLDHQCDMALAGAVGIKVPQKTGYLYQEGMINSPDGHCRTFDAEAKGTVGGNGVGVVVLKRLSDARNDGDTIHAVIRGFAINNDGSAKIGYTAPSIEGQAQVIAMAQAMADVDPDTITYVEAHGTATPLGDPIEIAALTEAFRAGTSRKNFCGIGSVKSNIGHLDPAAGIAGLIKTCLMLRHRQMPPSLHFKRPNDQIDFANSPFYVVQQLREWAANGVPRRAGVSSFGIGGTNAHVVLEEAPEPKCVEPLRHEQLLVLSARCATALEKATSNLAEYLRSTHADDLADVAYTSQTGRREFPFRRVVVASTREDAIHALTVPGTGRVLTGQASNARPVVFLFPGQGTQYANMTRGLYETEPTYRREVDLCSELLKLHLGLDLRTVLFPPVDRVGESGPLLEQTALAQPALFAVEYALAKLWMEWGIHPHALAGHSIGEYVAACMSGVFSLPDALALVARRGNLMQRMTSGAMLAVPLSEGDVQPFLKGNLDLAAVNGVSLCVVSGPDGEITDLQERLRMRNVESRRLHTSHAFHSRMMDAVVPSLADLVRSVNLKPPQIPCLSNTTGTWLTATDAVDPAYWARHLRQTVRFSDNLEHLTRQPEWILLEVGPGDTLSALARQHPKRQSDQLVVSSVRHPQLLETDTAVILNALGRLWLSGASIDWPGFHTHRRHRRVPLPTYPFERRRYWIEARRGGDQPAARRDATPKSDVSNWFYRPVWKQVPLKTESGLDGQRQRWLIFAEPRGLGERTAQRLRQQGNDAVTVLAGSAYARKDDNSYVIDPRHPEHYRMLIRDLSASGRLPQSIGHFWGVSGDEAVPANRAFDEAQSLGFYSVMALTQALVEQTRLDSVRIEIVTSHLHAVTGDEAIQPGKATVLAAAKVVPQEHPHIRCRSIDVPPPGPGDPPDDELVSDLLAEFKTRPPETTIAYRRNQRWAQNFEPVRLQSGAAGLRVLREHGVYLITGGLGKIGLTLAENLARAVRASLVLLTRSEFPAVADWPQWLRSHGDADRVSRAIRRLQAIEQLGARVLVLRADAGNPEDLTRIVKEACHRFGSINGVIHAAGETSQDGFCGVVSATPDACERQFRPKVRGLLALEEALSGKDVDFWVLFSSLSAVLGGLRFAPYAAANAFLDAFASRKHQTGHTNWISINWDGWDFSGGAAGAGPAILPDQGGNAFRLILSQGALPQVVVSVTDLEARLAQWIELPQSQSGSEARSNSAELHSRPNLSNEYAAPRDEVERTIAAIWQELLGLDQVGIHDNFFELGGHSLVAIQVVSRLHAALRVDVAVHALFETPTVAQLAQKLSGQDAIGDTDEPAKMAELLDVIEGMSDSEIQAILSQEGQS